MLLIELYDHIKRKTYTLDLEKWLAGFNDDTIYFYSWREKILNAYEKILYKPTETDGCFQYPYVSNGELFYIHFNIGNIKKNCVLSEDTIYSIPLKNFGASFKNRDFIYYPTKSFTFEHVSSSFPIVCCDIPSFYVNRQLVIDGNHRITAKKFFHKKNVNVCFYEIEDEKDFSNLLEYTIYHFLLQNNIRNSK